MKRTHYMANSTPTPATVGSGTDTFVLDVSENAYQGDAQFTVAIDGKTVGPVQTVTASHASGQEEAFTYAGNYGTGPHTVAVTFVNDAYGGSSAADRNLYVDSVTLDGGASLGSSGLYSNGSATFQVGGASAAAPTPSTPQPAAPANPAPSQPAAPAPGHMSLVGVNLAGPAFDPADVPGTVGTNYVYPTHAEIDYFAAKGMNVFRLSFLMERLEHSQGGAFDAAEQARIDDVVNYAASKGVKTILDPHNFGTAWGNDIGTAGTPASSLTTFNGKLADHYKNNSNVLFGIMNEAHDQSATQWEPIVQDSVNAIRAAGATSQEILVPGTYWQNAKDWTSSDNASVMGKVQDPNHNMAFELHMYFDAGSGGAQPDVVSPTIGVERITDATKWAEATGNKLFLGEFGVPATDAGLTALNNTLTYMDQHSGAWQGATYWAAGPGWGDMFMSIEPANGVDKPQMGVLAQHIG